MIFCHMKYSKRSKWILAKWYLFAYWSFVWILSIILHSQKCKCTVSCAWYTDYATDSIWCIIWILHNLSLSNFTDMVQILVSSVWYNVWCIWGGLQKGLTTFKGPLSYKYILTSVDVYESIHHKIITCYNLNVYHIFLNNISFIFLYCTKPRLLKNPQIIPCAFCNVIEGKNKHNNTQHYAPYHN